MPVQTQTKRGLALPATRTRGGYFAAKAGEELAFGTLLLALFTPIGSRPMRRAWGSGLSRLLMETVERDDVAVQMTVRDTARQYCPDVRVGAVGVVVTRGEARLSIAYSLAAGGSSGDDPEASRPVLVGDLL